MVQQGHITHAPGVSCHSFSRAYRPCWTMPGNPAKWTAPGSPAKWTTPGNPAKLDLSAADWFITITCPNCQRWLIFLQAGPAACTSLLLPGGVPGLMHCLANSAPADLSRSPRPYRWTEVGLNTIGREEVRFCGQVPWARGEAVLSLPGRGRKPSLISTGHGVSL